MRSTPPHPSDRRAHAWALIFGFFLSLALLKFGNPVVLDRQIPTVDSLADFLHQPWPLRWSFGLFALIAITGFPLVGKPLLGMIRRIPIGLWLPLLLWLLWQTLAAGHTVDATLTTVTLVHLFGVVIAYALGAGLLSHPERLSWMLAGLLAGFCICLMRANTQRLIEFPADRAMLIEGARTGWTNFPPEAIASLKREGLIVSTNGVDVPDPRILSKLERGRVHGTLVYPNALAGIVLLLLPTMLHLVSSRTVGQRPWIRWAALGLLTYLGATALLWSGSKSGWLIALAMGLILLFWLPLPRRLQFGLCGLVLVGGLLLFALRFQGYFASGATSVGARFDYWRAAVQTTRSHPVTGTGPGTFQRPYAQLKAPESEMARLVHNDYLEQFSDSGIPAGLAYLWWSASWLILAGRWSWRPANALWFPTFLGVAGWLAQGMSEFSLYVPALAWTAFALAGAITGAMAGGTIPTATPFRSPPATAAPRPR